MPGVVYSGQEQPPFWHPLRSVLDLFVLPFSLSLSLSVSLSLSLYISPLLYRSPCFYLFGASPDVIPRSPTLYGASLDTRHGWDHLTSVVLFFSLDRSSFFLSFFLSFLLCTQKSKRSPKSTKRCVQAFSKCALIDAGVLPQTLYLLENALGFAGGQGCVRQ